MDGNCLSARRRAQSSMVMLVLAIIIVLGMVAFLFGLARTVSSAEYLNLYAHGLVASVLKTDTGYTEAPCKTVADSLACAYLTPSYICGGQETCADLADRMVNASIGRFAERKESLRYLLTVEPEGFSAIGGEGVTRVELGELSLRKLRESRISAAERLTGFFGGQPYVLTATLVLVVR
ncbi:MAG: hypothetical protein HY520_04640 [Candidatus Aenigmarchaeota archaeon]|nr:hypothetical protein [Candidatus Aenigmarchaeota archaeon]